MIVFNANISLKGFGKAHFIMKSFEFQFVHKKFFSQEGMNSEILQNFHF